MTNTDNTDQPSKAPIDSKNAAWVTIPAKQSVTKLAALCDDIEAIIRVNPYYVYKEKWVKKDDNCYETELSNLSNEQVLSLKFCVERETETRWVIHYEDSLKTKTVMEIEATDFGSQLTITDDYKGITEKELETRENEVDKSLKAWGTGLHSYFLRWKRLSWIPGWKLYTRRVWIPMNPSARRITYMLLMIEFAFIGLFGFSMLILWIEQNYPG